ncbi:hypothetical protein GCM10007880_65560 [Mesorhizobium amorphae]|nr:hypothetical protein GCM10007880_65560 [Mesorhizobium amorphae]
MTKEGCELGEQSLDVLAGLIPCDDTVDGCCVTKIMDAWWTRFADRAFYTGGAADMLEHGDDTLISPSSNAARRE